MAIDTETFKRDLETLSKADFLAKYPKARLSHDVELLSDVVAEAMGRLQAENDKKFAALEAEIETLRDERARFVSRLQELENQVEDMSADAGTINAMQTQINSMKVENDLILRSLRADHSVSTADAVRALRSIK